MATVYCNEIVHRNLLIERKTMSKVHQLKIIVVGTVGVSLYFYYILIIILSTKYIYFLIILVQSGKTTISNFLADATEIPSEHRPTKGVRILEFETQNINVRNKFVQAEIEMWDCSGDHRSINPS